ncbi:hypothetical protein EX30DRAFT_338451 [Ascodesmis nigricans]|uniref:NADH-ubiquinone oxidoreductase 21 kDa subunit n=1 Tax=Ascodesmis nigricans TaxID=341454 RepID=A0A4S2N3S0_9PEZI|nr:hypothetical protein EX30DRAFT_338451 [Ascodesmis nigricans]
MSRVSMPGAKLIETEYPVIDIDPHFFRVVRYARPGDWAVGAGTAVAMPAAFHLMNYFDPVPHIPKAGIQRAHRLLVFLAIGTGFCRTYIRSSLRFWGWTENAREVEMDMREMVDKVKRKEPLYGVSRLDPYLQGVAARTSTYSQKLLHVFPMFNFVNHNQHGVDTRKYFLAAEEELEREEQARLAKVAAEGKA